METIDPMNPESLEHVYTLEELAEWSGAIRRSSEEKPPSSVDSAPQPRATSGAAAPIIPTNTVDTFFHGTRKQCEAIKESFRDKCLSYGLFPIFTPLALGRWRSSYTVEVTGREDYLLEINDWWEMMLSSPYFRRLG